MLGVTHATTGIVAGLAAVPVVDQLHPVQPAEAVALVLVAGGYAMWPDVDHHSATIAQTFGPLTRSIARLFARLFGPHRGGTHSLVFVAGSGVVAQMLHVLAGPVATGVLLAFGIGLTLRALGLAVPGHASTTAALHFPAAAAGSWWLLTTGLDAWWIGPAVALGTLAHIAGDCLTEQGCPLGWPWSKEKVGLPLMDTSSWAETVFGTLVSLLGVWLLIDLSGRGPELLELARWSSAAVRYG